MGMGIDTHPPSGGARLWAPVRISTCSVNIPMPKEELHSIANKTHYAGLRETAEKRKKLFPTFRTRNPSFAFCTGPHQLCCLPC